MAVWARGAISGRNRPALIGTVTLLAALCVVTAGCTGTHRGSAGSSAGGAAIGEGTVAGADKASGALAAQPPSGAANGASTASTPVQQRDIVRTASLAVEVTDVDRAAETVRAWTARAGGRVDVDDRDSQAGARHAQLVLRLPPTALETMIAQAAGLGTEQNRTDHGQDVTASHADVNARVSALRTSVGRLTDFLKASGSVSDLVALESQLSQRESDLESMLAQQRALADQIALASLTVDLSGKVTKATDHHNSLPAGFGSALVSGVRLLLVAGRWSLAVLGYLLPFGLIVLLVLAPLGWARRRRAVKPTVPPPAAS